MRKLRSIAFISAFFFLSCGGAPTPSDTAPKDQKATQAQGQDPSAPLSVDEPQDPSMPVLRTGPIAPIIRSNPIVAEPLERFSEGDHEITTWGIRLESVGLQEFQIELEDVSIIIDHAAAEQAPLAFLERRGGNEGFALWVRRNKTAASQPVSGKIYLPSVHDYGEDIQIPGQRIEFRGDAQRTAKENKQLIDLWARALSAYFNQNRGHSPFHAFAAERVLLQSPVVQKTQAGAQANPLNPNAGPRYRGDDLSMLMETTTGVTSIQEALQHERGLLISALREKAQIPIEKLKGPDLKAHPFKEMLIELQKTIPASRNVPAEPLAKWAPADFWYVRFESLQSLFRLVDEADTWGTPAANVLDERAEDRRVSERYETALGISRGPLSRSLGPSVVADLAAMGSDPYIKEGTDITIVFRLKQRALFEAGMGSALSTHGEKHGGITSSTINYDGTTIKVARSGDGAVYQHRASAGDIEIVSNSPNAIKSVLDTIKGKRARLSDEPDFAYMLARDAEKPADVLAFMGDRFIASVIGPKQKILEARRQLALAELSTPGFAALLYGWIWGKSPASTDDLIKANLLNKAELQHEGGEKIQFTLGKSASSSWGSPSGLTPLIDLPAPTMITSFEERSYERFVQGYQSYWSEYIDPIAIRLAIDAPAGNKDQKGTPISADVRILPLIDQSEYRQIQRDVGSARIVAPPFAQGARVVLGVGENAELRRELSGMLRGGFSRRHSLKVDWLGEWAMLGVADRTQLVTAAVKVMDDDTPERPRTAEEKQQRQRVDEIGELAQLPLFAAIGLKSTPGAALAIAGARAIADDVLPGLVEWNEIGKHRSIPVVRIKIDGGAGISSSDRPIQLYYAFCESALITSFRFDVLRRVLDERLDNKTPAAAPIPKPGEHGAPQLAVDLSPNGQKSPLWTLAGWVLEEAAQDAHRRSMAMAEALFRGAPEKANDAAAISALGLSVFGAVPIPPDGGTYSFGPEGVRDPARGSRYAPSWPAVPVPGSPVDKLVSNISRFRAEMSFDDEPKPQKFDAMTSLHARIVLGTK